MIPEREKEIREWLAEDEGRRRRETLAIELLDALDAERKAHAVTRAERDEARTKRLHVVEGSLRTLVDVSAWAHRVATFSYSSEGTAVYSALRDAIARTQEILERNGET